MIEQAAGTRRVLAAEDRRRVRHSPAEPLQQTRSALQRPATDFRPKPESRAASDCLGKLEPASLASARSGSLGHVENSPSRNIARLASARPSERPIVSPLFGIAETPRRPGAGIEQHADDRKIERRARALGGATASPSAGRCSSQRSTPSMLEMPPARMKRHVERGIGRARGIDHQPRRIVEAIQIDAKIRQPIAERQHPVRPLAHGCGAEQATSRQPATDTINTFRAAGRMS